MRVLGRIGQKAIKVRFFRFCLEYSIPISRFCFSADFARLDPTTEKQFRSKLYSTVTRQLSKSSILIVDGINGIKGVRYQLFCLATAMPTQYAVVHVVATPDQAKEWNGSRGDRYTDEQWVSTSLGPRVELTLTWLTDWKT
jgi:hypothetical protein